jgi:hypothetical protein
MRALFSRIPAARLGPEQIDGILRSLTPEDKVWLTFSPPDHREFFGTFTLVIVHLDGRVNSLRLTDV